MIRAVVHLLLAVFSLGQIAPALAGSSETNLPACCRRDGNHHCAKPAAPPATGIEFSAAKQKCPLYPRQTVPGQAKFFVPPISSFALSTQQQAPAIRNGKQAAIRVAATRHPRGPPISS